MALGVNGHYHAHRRHMTKAASIHSTSITYALLLNDIIFNFIVLTLIPTR